MVSDAENSGNRLQPSYIIHPSQIVEGIGKRRDISDLEHTCPSRANFSEHCCRGTWTVWRLTEVCPTRKPENLSY